MERKVMVDTRKGGTSAKLLQAMEALRLKGYAVKQERNGCWIASGKERGR